ncbi:MAG: 3-keto-5-aminohexanoate cleavage protein, partial [Firmicutes bacterium]|nr:3-keto-5-aminohexanoate cleavage protein [Bacillota bacterium]
MILAAKDLKKKGLLKEPLYFNFIMGLKGAQEADVTQLAHLINMLPEGSEWNISGVGKNQIVTTMLGIALGGHVRVGLEDNIYYSKGVPASNAQLVERVARLAKEFGREIATPDEAREILGLKDE